MIDKKNIFVFTSERIFTIQNKFYCENKDIKTILEGISKTNYLEVVSRTTKQKKTYNINVDKIYSFKNLFKIFFNILKKKDRVFLFISIHPFTFFFFLISLFIKKKNFLFLRSDGFKEYEYILGKKFIWIYHLMFYLMIKSVKIISCHESLSKGKAQHLVKPSELEPIWFKNYQEPNLSYPNLLYLGRLKKEKGIFSLIKILSEKQNNVKLTIVGEGNLLKVKTSEKIILKKFINNSSDLINEYDNCNVFILPSFTEAQPKVVYEALARKRPIIIFDEISHISKNLTGIFICKREYKNLIEVINYILKNYPQIQRDIEKNILPSKQSFLEDFINFLNK